MKRKRSTFVGCLLIVIATASLSAAGVEWNIVRTLNIAASPRDMVISPDGRNLYVLADDGNIYIYAASGTFEDKIHVGRQVEQIDIDPEGEQLYLISAQDQTLKVIELNFIYDIRIKGSPFKGTQNAPLVLAVFSDFQ